MLKFYFCFCFLLLLACSEVGSISQNYQSCYGSPQLTLWLSPNGHCLNVENCRYLENCTTLYGNLIVRNTVYGENVQTIKPHFPRLQEITGYVAITFYSQAVFDILPSLSVIRGVNLVQNYALVVYFNELKSLYLPKLTTILNGGVRIDRNSKLCYASTIRWKSIVKDKDQEEKYGIVLESNNLNCDTSCITRQCYAAPGHSDDPTAQYCWGPGNIMDPQCQKFCDRQCGLNGCQDDTINVCCHEVCMGGCTSADSAYSCHACKNYRVHETGECVSKCPSGYFLVNDLVCERSCPGWNDSDTKISKEYLLDGRCVKDCPAGYLQNEAKHTCTKCKDPLACPRVCRLAGERPDGQLYEGALIRIPSHIQTKGLAGCTEIIGSLTFEIQRGTGNVESFDESLKWLRIIRGHLKIHKSSLKSLKFLKNLEILDPPKPALLHGAYALMIYDNNKLEKLWSPRSPIQVTRGEVFAQSNPRLCPHEIFELQANLLNGKGNVTGDISKENNGNRVVCQIKRLEIQVEEFVLDAFTFMLHPRSAECFYEKCVRVNWNFTRDGHSYSILFYTIYYLKLVHNETADKQVADDFAKDKQWQTLDVEKKPLTSALEKFSLMTAIIKSLDAHARYAFYIKEVVTNGEGRLSKISYIQISQGIPSAPLGVEASFLSANSIHLQWRPPDRPNGVVISYQLYWQKASYSFWEEQQSLDWCNRDVKAIAMKTKEKVVPQGTCSRNYTCVCDTEEKKSTAVLADREAARFQGEFQERINKVIFTKPQSVDEDLKGDEEIRRKILEHDKGTRPPETVTIASKASTTTEEVVRFNEPNIKVSGDTLFFVVSGLGYFQDYLFKICACTGDRGGCAVPTDGIATACASAQARTDINPVADNLNGVVNVSVEGSTYNISWVAPVSPNAIVLKYDVLVRVEDTDDVIPICRPGNAPTAISRTARPGKYTVKIRAISPAGNGSWSETVSFSIKDTEKSNTLIMGVSVGAVALILVLLSFVVYYAFFKRSEEKGAPGVLYASVNPEYMNSSEVYIPDEWELNREKIELIREIAHGSFGMVYEGIAHEIADHPELRVAVKTVNENASIRDRIEFLQEASIMKAFNSNHVVKLIGVVSQGQPTFVVMELMGRGDLKSFLRGRRPEENANLLPPMRQEIFQMTSEIADGMAYLAARKFVHRDLAARNCMVAFDFTVKVGDFGMARDIYETDYYRKGGKGLLPVRWMAPESLKDGIFTTASDIWSFGVVLWEIVTLAAQPYQGKSNEEVLRFVLNGGQLVYPDDCDKQMKEFMELCWQRDPKLRPSFLEIIRRLEDDVSEDFMDCSFYHEMKKKALEDTLCKETNLLGLLNSSPPERAKECGKLRDDTSLSSIDSGAFIENSKPEADQSPEFPAKISRPAVERAHSLDGSSNDNTPTTQRQCRSVYDNYGTTDANMKYGDTPICNTVTDDNVGSKLQLSKIFHGKPVPV